MCNWCHAITLILKWDLTWNLIKDFLSSTSVVSFTTRSFQSRLIFILFPPVAAVSGAEDVALYVGMVAVALCLTLLLIVVVLVYRRKKEGLDADVADSSILTTGFQPMGIKPSKPGVWAPRPRRPPPHSSRTLFFVLPSSVRPSVLRLPTVTVQHSSTCTTDPVFVCGCGGGVSVFTVVCSLSKMYYVVCLCVCAVHELFICLPDTLCFATTSLSGNVPTLFTACVEPLRFTSE